MQQHNRPAKRSRDTSSGHGSRPSSDRAGFEPDSSPDPQYLGITPPGERDDDPEWFPLLRPDGHYRFLAEELARFAATSTDRDGVLNHSLTLHRWILDRDRERRPASNSDSTRTTPIAEATWVWARMASILAEANMYLARGIVPVLPNVMTAISLTRPRRLEFGSNASPPAFLPFDEPDDTPCVGCEGELGLGPAFRSKCRHLFHVGCFNKWIRDGNVACPSCGDDVD